MSWRESLAAYALERKLPAVITAEGVGVEFTDGCDTFWVLPGEVTSSIPVYEREPGVAALIGEFERIDRLRTSVLHVIRHDVAERGIFLDRRLGGEWGVMTACGVSSSISVGPILTVRAAIERDVYGLVASCYDNTILGKPPSRGEVERYLATHGFPSHERPWPAETPTIGCPTTLRSVLLTTGLCKAVEDEANLMSPEKLAEAAVPTGRLGRALLHLADRLPQVAASCELTDGSLALEFDDAEDSLRIARRSRELVRRVRSLGIEGAGDQLADEYLRLNAARRLVLDAVKYSAFHRGWGVERVNPFFLATGIPALWHLGLTRREVQLRVGRELTDLLRVVSPEQAIRQLLAQHHDFADECIAALAREGPSPTLPKRDLAPAVPTRRPRLRVLDAQTMTEMDAFADRTLAAYLRSERTIWDYRWSNRFDSAYDTWATSADWVRLGERLIGGNWPNPAAVLVLVDVGDPRGLQRARYLLQRMEPHHEVTDAEVELAWRFRHELPDVARAWFAPQPFDQVPFAEHRAKLGDPVARRYLLANEAFELNDETTWSERANPAVAGLRPDAHTRTRLSRRLMEWARTTWKWSPAEPLEMLKAIWLGLDEVADALDENSYLANGLLCGDRGHFMFDEPGILLSGDFLLEWSRLKPTRLLGQIVATAHTGEILAEAERIAQESAQRNPSRRANRASSIKIYESLWENLQVPMAIAWKRFRSSARKRPTHRRRR
jgi:hypothetical protein